MGDQQRIRYANIIRAVLARPWAIDPDSLAWAAICDVLAIRASGGTLSDEEISSRIEAAGNGPRLGSSVVTFEAARGGGPQRARNVAVIPIYGVISPRLATMSRMSGGTAADAILGDFRAAMSDPDVDGIVFDVDSPGGNVEGIDELAAEIRGRRGEKPIAAVANHLAASAAYWAIAGVDELVATPSASVGSIGVFTAHQDVSGAMEQKGVRTTLVSAGKYKVEGNQFEPLGDEARAALQADVDAWYGAMVASIAKGRGVSVDTVRAQFGEGRVLLAKKAVDRGMVDRIDSLENTIRRVARGAVGAQPKAAALVMDGSSPDVSGIPIGAGAAPSFVDRIEAVAAEANDIAGEARKRAELRAEEGRQLSEATREGLVTLADSLRALAEPPTEEDEDEDEPDAAPSLSVVPPVSYLEAALSGGYSLPD